MCRASADTDIIIIIGQKLQYFFFFFKAQTRSLRMSPSAKRRVEDEEQETIYNSNNVSDL